MSGIVLDTGTETGLPEHLNIEIRPFRNPLGLDQLVFALEKLYRSFISSSILSHAALIFS